jgi:hypothetical protein
MFPYLIVLLVIIVAFVFKSTQFHVSSHRCKNWLQTEGTVYICRVGAKYDSSGEEFAESRIKCLYKVKGVAYTLTIENAGLWNSTQWEWGNVSRYYPSPFTCTVQYDPKNPRCAFVKPQEGRKT